MGRAFQHACPMLLTDHREISQQLLGDFLPVRHSPTSSVPRLSRQPASVLSTPRLVFVFAHVCSHISLPFSLKQYRSIGKLLIAPMRARMGISRLSVSKCTAAHSSPCRTALFFNLMPVSIRLFCFFARKHPFRSSLSPKALEVSGSSPMWLQYSRHASNNAATVSHL
jgi:hypothetical protein